MSFVECPTCGYKLKYAAEHIGKKGRCQKCGEVFILPPIADPDVMTESVDAAPPSDEAISEASATPLSNEVTPPLVAGHPEIKELVPILCEHCSESYKVHNAMGVSMPCDKCQKTICVTVLDVSKLPGPHGPGEPGCVPHFRGDLAHYKAAFEAGSLAKARRQQLLNEGVLPGLLLSKLLEGHYGIKGEFDGGLKLIGANLRGAFFFFVYKTFEGADLRRTTLDGSNWIGTSLAKARFDGASLQNCSISGRSSLAGASFREADLTNSRLTLDSFELANSPIDFTGANLEGATLDVTAQFSESSMKFTKARMKGCKVPKTLLAVLSERQRNEVEVQESDDELADEERKIASERHRRFRSVPILGTKSQTHRFGANAGSVTASQTTYAMGDAREHVLEDHVKRHLRSWVWPMTGLAVAVFMLVVTAAGYFWLGWDLTWVFFIPPITGLVGAIGAYAANVGSRQIYLELARQDRGWKKGEKHPNLHIVFEHEWRRFNNSLR